MRRLATIGHVSLGTTTAPEQHATKNGLVDYTSQDYLPGRLVFFYMPVYATNSNSKVASSM